jgi:hypothetical protein
MAKIIAEIRYWRGVRNVVDPREAPEFLERKRAI